MNLIMNESTLTLPSLCLNGECDNERLGSGFGPRLRERLDPGFVQGGGNNDAAAQDALAQLMALGGFPEPFFAAKTALPAAGD